MLPRSAELIADSNRAEVKYLHFSSVNPALWNLFSKFHALSLHTMHKKMQRKIICFVEQDNDSDYQSVMGI